MAYQPGQSGNIAGRPKGSRNRVGSIITDALPDAIAKVVEQAKAGDLQACALLLKHGLPPLKAAHQPTPIIADSADMKPADLARTVTTSVIEGRLSPDIGQSILAGIQARCGIIESSELVERLDALEARAGINIGRF
ncbi:DUF5681 domain-containing protein [Aeromonas rivipollensis]|uniref:DUF5681 domain-containing protein n=1 Tax=Aeromonas TaxID=642 RepID=UPI003D249518